MSSEPPEKNKPQPEETNPEPTSQSMSASGGSSIQNAAQVNIPGEVHGDVVITVGKSETEELENYLDWAVRDFENRMASFLIDTPQPDEPFKSLEYFRVEDASIFFGRSAATRELFDKVVGNRLMILYGRSGAGKSSILNAGLSPLLLREARLPVYVRTHPFQENLVREIKQAIFPPSIKPWPKLLERLSLHEFLGVVCMHRSRRTRELVIILDQFEQFLVSLPDKKIHQPFIEILRDCYEDHILPVRFVISLKHENLGDLDPFEQYIPGILQNRYSLPSMSQEEVREAITAPVQRVKPDISFEPALIDRLIEELGGKNVELTHLQIVCNQLYNKIPAGQQVITTSLYEEQGGVQEILSTYLDTTLEPLPEYKHKVARIVLMTLVSSEATNRILRLQDLLKAVPPDVHELENVLGYLVDHRLLRRGDAGDASEYELAHAYLAEEIYHWIGEEDLKTRRAQELLQRCLASWRLYRIPANIDELDVLKGQIGYLLLDQDARKMLFESALSQGHDVDFWLEQMDDKQASARQAAEYILTNKTVGKKIAICLRENLAKEWQPDFLSVLWANFDSSKSWKKLEAARTLWTFRGWLPWGERVRVVPVLLPLWTGQFALFGLFPLVILSLAISQLYTLSNTEQPIRGQWVTIDEGGFTMGMDEEEAKQAYADCMAGNTSGNCSTAEELLKRSGRLLDASLPQFDILENEVTTAQYQLCIDAGKCTEPDNWDDQRHGSNEPVRYVTWFQASDFCVWLGGRLPTDAEWEKAARGTDQDSYPWGPDWISDIANLENKKTQTVLSIRSFAKTDLSDDLVSNLAGNVREWTATRSSAHQLNDPFHNEDPLTEASVLSLQQTDGVAVVVLRGGSWKNDRSEGMVSKRGKNDVNRVWENVGFRCACPGGQHCESPGEWWWSWLTGQ